MTYKLMTVAAALLTFSTPVMADESNGFDIPGNFSGNASLTTDYVFRGISQSNEEPAIQGGFDWAHEETGLYLGIWGSNVDFTDADIEIDYYGGINGAIDQFTWDIGAIYYTYPGAAGSLNYDYAEVALALGYDFEVFSTSLAVNYSPEFFGDSGDAWYTQLSASVPLPYELTLDGSVGYQTIEDNAAFGVEDYTDWSIGLGYTLEGFDLSLKYIGTDLSEPDECADNCGDRVVFSVSRSF